MKKPCEPPVADRFEEMADAFFDAGCPCRLCLTMFLRILQAEAQAKIDDLRAACVGWSETVANGMNSITDLQVENKRLQDAYDEESRRLLEARNQRDAWAHQHNMLSEAQADALNEAARLKNHLRAASYTCVRARELLIRYENETIRPKVGTGECIDDLTALLAVLDKETK